MSKKHEDTAGDGAGGETGTGVEKGTEKAPSSTAGWDPLDRLGMGELLNRWPSWLGSGLAERLAREMSEMKVEEYRDGDRLVVRAEVPGVDPDEDIDISVDSGRLTIRATRRQETTSDEDGYRSEFRYGSFTRTLSLPEGADPEQISATYRDGILEVGVPCPAASPSRRRIEIRRG